MLKFDFKHILTIWKTLTFYPYSSWYYLSYQSSIIKFIKLPCFLKFDCILFDGLCHPLFFVYHSIRKLF